MNDPSAEKVLSAAIKEKAGLLGFDLCGIAAARPLKEYESVIENWCSSGMNGEMYYLCRNIEKRINPALLFPGAKSVIVTGTNYYTEREQGGNGVPVISRYAYGINYHEYIIEKLDKLLTFIKEIRPGIDGISFVDSAPLLEKAWAREAGLGWPGKHSILINEKIGSFFFIGVIVLNTELDYDESFNRDLCGSCKLCINSCPTGAINENRTIDVRKCISYLTIESKSTVPEEVVDKIEGRVFGCDKCQEVCPWNKNAQPHHNAQFKLSDELKQMTREEWINLSLDQFERLFKNSAISRRKFDLFMKNVTIVTNLNT